MDIYIFIYYIFYYNNEGDGYENKKWINEIKS